MLEHISKMVGALALQETSNEQPQVSWFSQYGWIVITLGVVLGALLLVFINKRRGHPSSTQKTPEMKQAKKQRKKKKTKAKETRAFRRDIIKGSLFLGALWGIFYALIFHWNLRSLGINTAIPVLITVLDVVVVGSTGAHGFSKTLGMQAIRGTEKDDQGGRSKLYNILVGAHFPLIEAKIREIVMIFKDSLEGQPFYKAKMENITPPQDAEKPADATKQKKEKEPSAKELAIPKTDLAGKIRLDYKLDGEYRQTTIRKDRARFFDILGAANVGKMIEEINILIKRQGGDDASVAHIITNYLRCFMPSYGYKQVDIKDICTKIEKLAREEDFGIAFGGFHLEFAAVKQYDTNYVIWVIPYKYEECFNFSDRDEIDSSYIPIPMPYTDIDWRKIGQIEIQTKPEVEEIVNILMPIYTDKDVRQIPITMLPLMLDKLTKHQSSRLFKEPAADALYEQNQELKSDIQRLEMNMEDDIDIVMDKLRRFHAELDKARVPPGIRNNLGTIVMVALISILMTGIVMQAVHNAGGA